MVPHHHANKFLPNKKVFFPHDITLIASVVGDSVIGHGIGGINIPSKWRNLLKACRRSKQWHKLVTQSHSHSNRLMALRSKYVYMLLPICAQFRYANRDSPYAKFPASLPVCIRGVPVCIQGSVCDVSAIFPPVTHWSRILCTRVHTHIKKHHCITLFW